ncbi:MAG: zf-HC2 domain-containing protein [Calditrichia bacterium]|nr:zf-HC2 domain-containing protein [Calditrichia bacterium]
MKTTEENKQFNCADVEKNVHKFLDNQLSDKEKEKFEEHLDNCLPCDKKIEFEVKLKSIMKIKAKENSYPQELEQELKKIISERSN